MIAAEFPPWLLVLNVLRLGSCKETSNTVVLPRLAGRWEQWVRMRRVKVEQHFCHSALNFHQGVEGAWNQYRLTLWVNTLLFKVQQRVVDSALSAQLKTHREKLFLLHKDYCSQIHTRDSVLHSMGIWIANSRFSKTVVIKNRKQGKGIGEGQEPLEMPEK